MATIETIYLGDLRTEATHVASGNKIITDAPVDNNGKGEYFSPTDMVCAALASCMLTIMGISAKNHGFDIDGTRVKIDKIMAANPRRIAEIRIEMDMPHDYDEKHKRIIELAAKECPVTNSLGTDVKKTLIFNYAK